MSQTALEIWTVALVIITALSSLAMLGLANGLKRRKKYLSKMSDRLKAKDAEMDAREESFGQKVEAFNREKENLKQFSAEVFFLEGNYPKHLHTTAHKKLAQRIGCKIVSGFHDQIKEINELNGITFRFNIFASDNK